MWRKKSLNNYFLNESINTLRYSVNKKYSDIFNEGSFEDYLSWIPGWNFTKKLLIGRDQTGEAIGSAKVGIDVDKLIKNRDMTLTALNNISGDNETAKTAIKKTTDALSKAKTEAGYASGGLASYLPESVRNWMRDNGGLTTGIAVGAGILGLVYLYKKYLKNPNKPPDRQTLQYAQKLNNIQANSLSKEQLNAKIL